MKILRSILTGICIAALSGCATTSNPVTPANVALLEKTAVDAATAYTTSSPGAYIAAANDLFGIAAVAQGYLGKNPASANVAQGAAIPAIGSNVQAALPIGPITQATVNSLFQAAQVVAGKANNSTP